MKHTFFVLTLLFFGSQALFSKELAPPRLPSKESKKWQSLLRAKSHIHPAWYAIFTSDEKRLIWFRVFKAASETIKETLERQIPDIQEERTLHLPPQIAHYFTFAFVRNPWDRMVSCYFHKIVTKRSNEFKECFDKDFDFFVHFVSKIDVTQSNPHIRLQTRLIPVEQCDFIGRVENFDEDFDFVCNKIGIQRVELPRIHQTAHEHYSHYYTPKTRKIIAKLYREDIETFGFSFESK